MTVEGRCQTYSTFHYPALQLCCLMQEITPTVTVRWYSNFHSQYLSYLKVKWDLGQGHSALVTALFREALKDRDYSDSRGVVDHKNGKGPCLLHPGVTVGSLVSIAILFRYVLICLFILHESPIFNDEATGYRHCHRYG
eukprot:TRINITY_DN4319_c0_g2_i1.p1 TRINITY_DN4319_c0_g2~~TRINITY_DN4319_c0_g2_i1.p1  ORF type:complete len:139 (+),score=4.77 TRINITY_DN4319_c0_g2_i1:106-522(+)